MAIFELLVVEPTTGDPAYPLPDVKGLQLSPVFSSIGAVTFQYPVGGKNANKLRLATPEIDVEIAVMRDGVEIDDLRFLINEYDGNEADSAEESAMWTYNGRTALSLLERAIVYPPGFPSGTIEDTVKYTTATAGEIMGTLVTAAQGRGTLDNFDIGSFSQTEDSNGDPWTKEITIEYRSGLKYSEVLQNLVDQGMTEVKMVGRELKMYNPEAMSEDLTVGTSPIIFRKGRDLSDAPRKVSRAQIASVFLAGGSEGIYSEAVNSTGVATFGRWESFDSQGGVSDPGTLAAYAQYQRDLRAAVTMEKSHGLVFGPNTPEPVVDFNVGDWAWSDTSGVKERLRIKQWSVSIADNGTPSGIVVLGDLFSELQDRIVKRVNGILGGTTLTGESRATDVTDIIDDTIPPTKPLAVTLSSLAYTTDTGTTLAQITATWTAPALNTDGSPVTDLEGYNVAYRYENDDFGDGWSGGFFTDTTDISISPFATNTLVHIRVQAVDRSGNLSDWSDDESIMTALDNTPPPIPSTPTVVDYLSSLRVTWDGLGSVGEQMDFDFKYVEVHISDVNNFTPDASTLADVLMQGGVSVLSPVSTPEYNTDNYVKLISVDTSNNKSAASAQGVGQAKQVVSTDLAGNVVGFENIKFKDLGNIISDGSFELPETDAELANIAYFEVVPGDVLAQSPKVLSVTGTGAGSSSYLDLVKEVPCKPTQQFVLIDSVRVNVDVNVGAEIRFMLKRTYANATVDYVILDWYGSGSNHNNWIYRFAAYFTIPANCYMFDLFIECKDQTTGEWYVDELECRPVVGTALIQDLAVTNAKIGLLAVQDANVANMSVGKITAGTLGADVVVGARIKTADTGQRVELNSGGIGAWDASGNQTLAVAATGGTVTGTGTFSSGAIGSNQVRMSASGPWSDPAVWFVQPSKSWGFSPSVYSPVSDGSLRIISAEQVSNSSGRSQVWLFRDRWELATQWGNDATAPDSNISAAGGINIASGSSNPLELVAGGSSNSTMGLIDIKGKFPTAWVGNAAFMHYRSSISLGSGNTGTAGDSIVTWGPTWSRGDPRLVVGAERGTGAVACRLKANSSTSATFTATSLANGDTSATAVVWGWQW